MRIHARAVKAALLGLVVLTACETSTEPDVAAVAGMYRVTTLVVTEDGETADMVTKPGVILDLELKVDGTTDGHFFVPPNPGESGSGIDVTLEGTWSLNGKKVTLVHERETIIELIEYTYKNGRLTGSGEGLVPDEVSPAGLDMSIVLTRQ